ncbi:MAG: DUF47 family protein [Rikenellaceae bacterium]|jgi:predicted phosphate transport protein (TIGR00153 family)|nr:DUF47 family protein [Rikenellaceae bacterium]
MAFNTFMKFFLPKESKFFPLLHTQADDIIKASDLLIRFLQTTGHEQRKNLYSEIKKVETHCDQVTDEIFNELNNTFITPFDREDIHTLASQLDDILDMINASAKRTILYQPQETSSSMVSLAEHIRESALSILIAVEELAKKRRKNIILKTQCIRLHEIENSADDVYESFIISLVETEKNAIEMIKQIEISQLLESTTDKAYRVADTLKTIMVKYS